MKTKQVLIFKDLIYDKQEFFDKILENCDIDEESGRLYCKRCRTLVDIDWKRGLGYCLMHIISREGVKLKEVSYEIYI